MVFKNEGEDKNLADIPSISPLKIDGEEEIKEKT